MTFRVGLENNNEGFRSIAWALEHPGCFAYGADGESALGNLPQAIRLYSAWIAQHTASWVPAGDIEIHLEETWTDYNIDEHYDRNEKSDYYMVDAWFQHDWKPLTTAEIERGLNLLSWSRTDLLETIKGLSGEQRSKEWPNERWPIDGILNHIGGAEWWYMDRLDLAFPRDKVPGQPEARLQAVRRRLVEILPELAGSKQVVGVDGEIWSPRKMLRRAAWHERDHIQHIRKLLSLPSA